MAFGGMFGSSSEEGKKVNEFFKENGAELTKTFKTSTLSVKSKMVEIAEEEGFEKAMDYLNEAIREKENEENQKKEEAIIKKQEKQELKQSKKENKQKAKAYFKEYKSEIKSRSVRNKVESRMVEIAEEEGYESAVEYFNNIVEDQEKFFEKKKDYSIEVKYADQVYKAYVKDGISRIEKVNGRFLAAQNIKLDTIIEQNERIIELLEILAEK